jgi:hypothetical protein
VIILKGAYLAAVVYQNIALRELIDIDLLVHKEDLAQAAEIIMEMGYQPLKPFSLNWELTDKELPRFMKAHATGIDLHWSITTPGKSPRFDILDFWDQVRPVEIAKTTLLSLSPVDVLLHLCFHNAYGHQFAFSLRPYCDIQAVIRHIEFDGLNWDIVIDRANRWGWGRGVYLSLRLAGEFVGAEIPEYVLDTLKPEKQVEEFYVIAKTQTLSNPALVGAIDPRIASYQQMPAWEKAGLLVRRFFPTKVEIANKYQISPDTPIIWLKYPVRWRDMFVNHWRDFRDVQGGDEELTVLAEKKGKIIQWLSASDES